MKRNLYIHFIVSDTRFWRKQLTSLQEQIQEINRHISVKILPFDNVANISDVSNVLILLPDNLEEIDPVMDFIGSAERAFLVLRNKSEKEKILAKIPDISLIEKDNLQEIVQEIEKISSENTANETDSEIHSSELMHDILIASPYLIVVAQGDKLKFVNNKVSQLLGYPTSELLSRPFLDFVVQEDHERILEYQEKRLTGTIEHVSYRFRAVSRKNKIIWFEITGTRIQWEGLPATLNFLSPVTETVEKETLLNKREREFSLIFEQSPLGIVVFDHNLIITRHNRRFNKLTATEADSMVGRSLSDLPLIQKVIKENRLRNRDFIEGEGNYELEWKISGEKNPKYLRVIWESKKAHSFSQIILKDITDQKILSEAVSVSEQKYRELQENMHEGILALDKEGRILECNRSFREMTGYSEDELRNMKYWDITHPAYKRMEKDMFDKLTKGLYSLSWEKEFVTKERNRVLCEITGLKLRKNHDNENSFWIVARDITHDRKAENELLERELHFRTILEFSPYSLLHVDLSKLRQQLWKLEKEGIQDITGYFKQNPEQLSKLARKVRLLDFNQATLELTGIKNPDLLKKGISNALYHKGNSETLLRLLRSMLDGHNSFEAQLKVATDTGIEKPVLAKWVIVPGHEFTWDMIVVSLVDLSERFNYESRLGVLSRAIEYTPVSVVITDADGNIQYVNPKFTEVTGYTFEEAFGQNPRILKSGSQPPEFYEELWKTISAGKDWRGEFENKKKSGEIYWEWASISGVRDEQGEISHYVAIKEDITEKKKIEKELLKAKFKAEESDRLKTSFLANMSHEIRTPLNAIVGFTDLLRDRNLDDAARDEYFSIIKSSSDTLTQLIDDVLDIAKIESGQIRLIPEKCYPYEIITHIFKTFQNILDNRKNNVKILLKTDVAEQTEVIADSVRIKQIFSNLLSNAVKFTREGEIVIHCSLREGRLMGAVSDTGIGIPEDKQELIFERFRQADESTTRLYGGTGLGLWITKSLLKLMGGNIRVESEPGRGTTFSFEIPVEVVQEANQPVGHDENPSAGSKNDFIKGKTILIAEDNPANFEYLAALLNKWQIHILHATDGKEVLQIVEQEQNIDLILMDMQMPVLNGYEATKILKKIHPSLPIIAQTAFAYEEDRLRALSAGCDDYMAKPIKAKDLYILLENYLNKDKIIS